VFLLDYCGPSGFLQRCVDTFSSVVLLDHHKTAVDEVEHNLKHNNTCDVILRVESDMSGCMMALRYFFSPFDNEEYPAFFHGVEPPSEDTVKLMTYVQDGDLWHHKLPNTKEVSAGLRSLDIDYTPEAITTLLSPLTVEQLAALGAKQLQQEAQWIAEAMDRAYPVLLGTIVYWAAEIPSEHWSIVSELGHQLAVNETGYGAVVRRNTEQGTVQLSLRSDGPHHDTTVFSQSMGGGGHACASGCRMSEAEWNEMRF
jgi:oligoribonuclease NrnB/cAMP/cGMP phosphodiesterase (DHH superfamily)